MLQAHGAHGLRAGGLGSSPLSSLRWRYLGGVEEEVGGLGGADVEAECPVGLDGYADRHGCSGVDVLCAGVEFLEIPLVLVVEKAEGRGWEGERLTLQKSMDLIPLLPRAGPTGGLGLA